LTFSDAHCHVDHASVARIIEAEDLGVTLILVAGTDIESSRESVSLAADHSSLLACVGLHPWRADQFNEETLARLEELLASDRVAAISEIGLDYVGRRTGAGAYTTETVGREVQLRAFRAQLLLAEEAALPTIIHERGALDDVLRVVAEEKPSHGFAIHGFLGTVGEARRCIGAGAYLSIGPRALNMANNEGFLQAVKIIPYDRLLLETDSGDPAEVIKVAKRVAHLKELTVEEVGKVTTTNLRKLIGRLP